MKFKYDFLTKKLYKLQEEYTCEVSEDNYFRYPTEIKKEGFLLGNQERIIFSFAQTFFKVYYQQANLAYQKNLDLPVNGEIIFAFTDQDLISHAKI